MLNGTFIFTVLSRVKSSPLYRPMFKVIYSRLNTRKYFFSLRSVCLWNSLPLHNINGSICKCLQGSLWCILLWFLKNDLYYLLFTLINVFCILYSVFCILYSVFTWSLAVSFIYFYHFIFLSFRAPDLLFLQICIHLG